MTHNIPMGGTSGVEVVAEGGVSRRSVLQLAAFLGAGSLLGPSLVACAGRRPPAAAARRAPAAS